MALKGSSGGARKSSRRPASSGSTGRGAAGRGSKTSSGRSGGHAPKASGGTPRTSLQGSGSVSSRGVSGGQGGVIQTPNSGGGGRSRLPWLIIGVLVLLALCCVCSLVAAWQYGDSVMDWLRYSQ